ncbi:zf-HC2 domain-containing protein [Kaarinaea lacus]
MNPLRCDEVKNSLIDYLEFELPLTRREHFYEHLSHCASCQAMHDDLEQVLTEAKKIDIIEPPQSYWEELPENILNEVKSLRSSEPLEFTGRDESDDTPGNALSDDGKVVAFTRSNRRASGVKDIENLQYRDQQSVPVNHGSSNKKSTPISWPKIALPIAAAVLVGVTAVFTFIEKESTLFQDHIGFQAKIQSDQSLARLAQKLAPLSQPGNQFGFTSQQVLFNEFFMGSLFSEAKAYANSGQLVLLKTHLELLKTALKNDTNPQYKIIQSVGQLQQQLITQDNAAEASRVLTNLLNEYVSLVRGQDRQRYELVKAGAWLFDYALAVLAKDDTRIRQIDKLSSLAEALRLSKVPPGVNKSLDRIQDIAQQPTLTGREYQEILKEVENIRSLLG